MKYMFYKNILTKNSSKSKVTYWRRTFIFSLILTLVILTSGCEKQNQLNGIEENEPDEYYIKYEVDSSTIYMGGKLNVIFKNETNQLKTISIPTRSPWEAIIGPVEFGFEAFLKVSEAGNNYGHLKLNTKISVSKNNSPFALKVIDGSDNPRTLVLIQYTVDY